MTAYKTLSSFTESPTVAQTDYIVGYSFPIFNGERKWKWTNVVNQLTADMLGPMTNGQLLIGNSTTNAYVINTLTEGTGIDITNGPGAIQITADLNESLEPMTQGQLLIGTGVTGAPFTKNTLTGGNGISITNGSGTITIDVKPETPTSVTGPTINISNSWHGKMIVINNGATNTTINLDSTGITSGLDVSFIRAGTGTVEFVAGTGTLPVNTTSNAAGGVRSTPDNTFRKIAFTNSVAGAYYSGSGIWYIFGDLLT